MFKSVLISVANFEKSDSPYFVVMRECKTIVHSKLPLLSLQWNIQNNKKINYKKIGRWSHPWFQFSTTSICIFRSLLKQHPYDKDNANSFTLLLRPKTWLKWFKMTKLLVQVGQNWLHLVIVDESQSLLQKFLNKIQRCHKMTKWSKKDKYGQILTKFGPSRILKHF